MSDDEQDDRDETQDEGESESSDQADASTDTSADEGASSSGSDASDDDASDADDADDSDEAPAAATSTSAAKSGGKSGKGGGRMSAGARLAAAKAAKAAAKAAKKQARRDEAGASQSAAEREAEDLAQAQSAEDVLKESPLGRAATRAGEWTQSNRQLALGIAAAAVVALVGWAGYTLWSVSQARAAGTLLADALEISGAEIVSADDAADHDDDADEDDAPTFESVEARNTAALAAYRRVSSEYGSSPAAAWARLGEGRTLLAEGEYEDARTAYQAAFDTSGDESVVAWQALEGIGATYEAQSDWEHATSTYERLAALSDHAYESVANYHLARMRAASGDEAAALTSFRELVDALREEGSDGEPPFPYVLAQADQRLRELDPSAVGAGPRLGAGGGGAEGEEGGNPLEGLTPEQIQELIQRLQTKSGGTLPPE